MFQGPPGDERGAVDALTAHAAERHQLDPAAPGGAQAAAADRGRPRQHSAAELGEPGTL